MDERAIRVCVIGDELVAGVGDPRGLGWVGRVAARTPTRAPLTMLQHAEPGETTAELSQRWDAEVSRRTHPEADNRLVIGLGRGDLDAGISPARSRLNLANVLDVAQRRGLEAFVVGPPPGGPHADAVGELSAAFADVTTRRAIPYVETFAPLASHEQWAADLAAGDGTLPGQAGYGLLAWLVLHSGWHHWLGLPSDTA